MHWHLTARYTLPLWTSWLEARERWAALHAPNNEFVRQKESPRQWEKVQLLYWLKNNTADNFPISMVDPHKKRKPSTVWWLP